MLQQGIENATTTAEYGVKDTQAFLLSTQQQSSHILEKNYDELADHLELMLMGKKLESKKFMTNCIYRRSIECSGHIFSLNFHSYCFFVCISDTAEVVITQLKEKSKAVSLTQLATFVETLPQIEKDLHRMKEITGGLRVNASQLSDGMEFENDTFFCLKFESIEIA